MPYLNGLAKQYAIGTQYYANTHPSIGNYFELTVGQILTNDDGQTPQSFPVSSDNVVRRLLAAGKTGKRTVRAFRRSVIPEATQVITLSGIAPCRI